MEGEILAGLVRSGLSPDPASASVSVASRTDRGVHARGNALAMRSRLGPEALLRALNGISPEIGFTHAVEVGPEFRPRAAAQRWYRYFDRPADAVPAAWRKAASVLEGPLDLRSFARGAPAAEPTFRTVDALEARLDGGWLVVDVRARAFAWGMVRKIVGALREVEAGRLALEALARAARGDRRLGLPLAEPDRLVLWETRYPTDWTTERVRPSGAQTRWISDGIRASLARARILDELARVGTLGPGPVPAPR